MWTWSAAREQEDVALPCFALPSCLPAQPAATVASKSPPSCHSFHARFITITSSYSVVHEHDAHHHQSIVKQRLDKLRVRLSPTRFATRESPEDSRRQVQLHITNASLSAFRHGSDHGDDPVLIASHVSYSPRSLSYTCTHLRRQPLGSTVSMHHICDTPQQPKIRLH
jgi:hypothetical protein